LQDVLTERQDTLFLQQLLQAKIQELEESKAECREYAELIKAMAAQQRRWFESQTKVVDAVRGFDNLLTVEHRALIRKVAPKTSPSVTELATALTELTAKRPRDDVGASSGRVVDRRVVASPRGGGRGVGRGR
jgi:hypothetical protein